MTQPPHIDGLPLWAQITISLLFGVAALGAAYSGYFKRQEKAVTAAEPQSAAILAATISDGFAMRTLNESTVRLDMAIQQLCKTIDEQTHYARNNIELEREVCQRLRELREVSERLAEIAERHLK